jgi:hypothetical protein
MPHKSRHERLRHRRDNRRTSFISIFGSFEASTGCSGRDHLVCKLPLKCQYGESHAGAEHTKSATIQGHTGYVQHTAEDLELLVCVWLHESTFLIAC